MAPTELTAEQRRVMKEAAEAYGKRLLKLKAKIDRKKAAHGD